MHSQVNWSRRETLAALHVYLQLPFGQLHRGNARIKQLASWIGRTPNSVALKLVNLASLDPQVLASGRKGMGNASSMDKTLWRELNEHWDAIATEAADEFDRLAVQHGIRAGFDVLDEVPDLAEGKSRKAVVEVRVNQARFRRAVLASYNATCCICGLQHESLLIASHIVPWSMDTENRLNPRNGLCLSPLHDKAFDLGLITVLPDYTIRVAEDLMRKPSDLFMRDALLKFDRKKIRMPEKFKPDEEFLSKHARRFGFI